MVGWEVLSNSSPGVRPCELPSVCSGCRIFRLSNIHNRIAYIRSLSCGNEGYWQEDHDQSLRVGSRWWWPSCPSYIFHPSVFGNHCFCYKAWYKYSTRKHSPHISGQVRLLLCCWKNEKPNPKNRLLQPDPAHSLRVSSGEVPALFHRGCLPSPVPDTR